MNRPRPALLAAGLALVLASCTVSASGSHPEGASPIDTDQIERATGGDGPAWPKGDGAAPPARTVAPGAAQGEAGTSATVSGVDPCQKAALGPWKDVPHGPDPIGRVRDGIVPPLPDGNDSPPDQLTEFPDLADYRDPSTLEDPGMVYDAWKQAGFQRGIEARWGEGDAYTAITVVQFRDAAAARDALTAHLTDLCLRTTSATVRSEGNGLLLSRDSGAVRSVYVMDDVEVSVFTCSCYWADLERRQWGIADWAEGVQAALSGPGPKTGTA